MAHINFHPATGFGDLLPGWFDVPQNPIRDAGTPLVPSVQAVYPNQVTRKKTLGEFMSASFAVPQNPIIRTLATGGQTSGMAGLGCAGCGMGSLGQTGSTSVFTEDSLGLGLPNWAYMAGGAVLAWAIFMPGGSEYRQKKSALASQYRGYKRAKKAAAQSLS